MTEPLRQHSPTQDEIQDAVRKVLAESNKAEAAPPTAKEVSAAIAKAQPTWTVPERRVAKFLKKETAATMAGTKSGGKKFKLASPFGKKKKKDADIDSAADAADAATDAVQAAPSPVKEVAAATEAKVEAAASSAKSAAEEAATPVKEAAGKVADATKDLYSEEKEDGGPEPWCNACTIL